MIGKNLAIALLALILSFAAAGIILMRVNNPLPTPTPIPSVTPAISITLSLAPTTPPQIDGTGATEESIADVVKASNQFALEFYSNLKEKETGNIFFSPYSISTAVSMVYEGARAETASEIRKVFHLPENDADRRSSVAAIYNQLNKKDAKYKLSTANALWVQQDYKLLPEYLATVEKYYGGKATNVDFVGATEKTREKINAWVESQTNDKIKDLFPKGSLTPTTRLVLTNAVYFKGIWVKQFEKKQTKDEDFKISESETVKVPMMSRTDEKAIFGYAEDKDLQILEMPYEGDDLSMLVFLPADGKLSDLEKTLTPENLGKWRKDMSEQRVRVYIPKFTFDTKYTLNDNLAKLGMPSAFMAGKADMSGINGGKDLFIQTVIHQAFVDVNEEGTEAAAATGVSVGITSVGPKPLVFRADHPFIFLIQEKQTGNILFIGRVANPVK